MKSYGIICEYNPFHNGHKYQIDYAKEKLSAGTVVALMSGNFVQRGAPAILSKEVRSEIAINCGVDLVIENPAFCVLRSAEKYADSAVFTMTALGIDCLLFGAECESLDDLYKIAEFLSHENDDYKSALSEHLSKGLGYASARSEAISHILGKKYAEILSAPNNILAVEYIKAIIRQGSPIEPVAVKRMGSEHDSSSPSFGFASASLIRDMLREEKSVSPYVPKEAFNIIKNAPLFIENSADASILSALCLKSGEEIANAPDISEGLENKIKAELLNCNNLDELIDAVKSKRYAYSRIKRSLLCSYLSLSKEDAQRKPEYIKILNFNEVGRAFLNKAKKEATLPVAKNASPLKKNSSAIQLWNRELYFDKVYDIFLNQSKKG